MTNKEKTPKTPLEFLLEEFCQELPIDRLVEPKEVTRRRNLPLA